MDTGLLNLGEEHFAFNVFDEFDCPDDSTCDTNRPYFTDWDDDYERELNGDIGLIPVASGFGDTIEDISSFTAAPTDLFERIGDWSTLINQDVVPVQEGGIADLSSETTNFQLANYLYSEPPLVKKPIVKAGVKKIDLNAQKYIVEDDQNESDDLIDVETVLDVNLPVLEAYDALALLEQFEASESPNLAPKSDDKNDFSASFGFDNMTTTPMDIFEELPPPTPAIDTVKIKEEAPKKIEKKISDNKQILNAFPKDLIARINESGKRKTITVIPPIIPNKKRNIVKVVSKPSNEKVVKESVLRIHTEHDYCTFSPKDSGFQSSEDDDRSIMAAQPVVKNADGKLMVSLLKVNTIRNGVPQTQKKKLNLEEYKKKRLLKVPISGASSSSSACSSPAPEDEHVKRLKHQEKMQKMALELLKTAPKSCAKQPVVEASPPSVYPKIPESYIDFPYVVTQPPGLEVRKVVNIGVNTDVSNVNNKELSLKEIEPLLKKASAKINSNSFINSLIENIPKMRASSKPILEVAASADRKEHFLPVHGPKIEQKSICVQTDFDELIDDIQARYRRRLEESSSSASSKSVCSVSSSSSSVSSYSRGRSSSRRSRRSESSYLSTSSGRSRSGASSPKRERYSREKMRDVEERRVVYVGGLLPKTSREDLRRRFSRFGQITHISLHFRDFGDNYGFVTFSNKLDAYNALEHGNAGGAYPKYDLSFGGRRIFCKTSYADLDNVHDEEDYYGELRPKSEDSFDDLLRECQERIKRKS